MKKIVKTIMMAVAFGGLFPAAATAQSYQLVTSTSDLESGKRYLIVAESRGTYYAWSGFRTGIQSGTATTMSVSNGTITSAGDATPFLLVKSDDKWKIIDLKTEKYLGVLENGANQLSESSAFNSNRFLWNISFDNSGKLNVYQMHSDKGQYLKFTYSLALGAVFSIFSQSDQSVISLYKETGEAGNTLILQNGSDNSGAISEAANSTCNVILEDRILHKDGNWNTLCLPFNHGKTGPLADATIMELDTEGKYKYDGEKWEIDATNGTQKTGFNAADGTLYLFFKTAESIEAGKPYIIKWEGASSDIDSPIFSNVTVSSATSDVTSSDGKVVFKGTYGPVTWNTETKSILFLGTENTLYYPLAGASLGACRAYFQLNGINANVREFNLNFDEQGTQTTGIIGHTDNTDNTDKADAAWYTINGVRLSAKPTSKGLYVHGNRKVVIK